MIHRATSASNTLFTPRGATASRSLSRRAAPWTQGRSSGWMRFFERLRRAAGRRRQHRFGPRRRLSRPSRLRGFFLRHLLLPRRDLLDLASLNLEPLDFIIKIPPSFTSGSIRLASAISSSRRLLSKIASVKKSSLGGDDEGQKRAKKSGTCRVGRERGNVEGVERSGAQQKNSPKKRQFFFFWPRAACSKCR